jgi:hypothetical protein
MKRLIAYLLSAVVTAALLIGMPQSASAHDPLPLYKCDRAPLHWVAPYASTGYGPVARSTETQLGQLGFVGFYSPLTGDFKRESGWMDLHADKWYHAYIRPVNSSYYYETVGYGSFNTSYGPVVWATQFADQRHKVRWGTWSLITNRFDPATAFMPATAGKC